MLIAVSGSLGSGKTTLLTYFAYAEDERQIYANYHIDKDNCELIDVTDLEMITNGLILIDEAYLWMDSRLSTTERNRYLSRMAFQSRKRQLDIVMSAQLRGSIDLRIRHLQDVHFIALGSDEQDTAFKFIVAGFGDSNTTYLPYKFCEERLFPLFSTREFPDATPTKYEQKKYNERVEEGVELIKNEFGEQAASLMSSRKLTKGMIQDVCYRNDINSNDIIEAVYSRIKAESVKQEMAQES